MLKHQNMNNKKCNVFQANSSFSNQCAEKVLFYPKCADSNYFLCQKAINLIYKHSVWREEADFIIREK